MAIRVFTKDLFNAIKPICHRCQKKVDELFTCEDFRTRQLLVAVKCHGEIENMGMDIEFFMENKFNLRQSFAFIPKVQLSHTLSIEHD